MAAMKPMNVEGGLEHFSSHIAFFAPSVHILVELFQGSEHQIRMGGVVIDQKLHGDIPLQDCYAKKRLRECVSTFCSEVSTFSNAIVNGRPF